MNTLKIARDVFAAKLPEGSYCPCCDRWGKAYEYPISTNTLRKLAICAQLTEPGGNTVRTIDLHNADTFLRTRTFSIGHFTYLRFLGLVEHVPRASDDTNTELDTAGWRITQKGLDFLSGKIPIPHKLTIYANRVLSVSDEQIFVNPYLNLREITVRKVQTQQPTDETKGQSSPTNKGDVICH